MRRFPLVLVLAVFMPAADAGAAGRCIDPAPCVHVAPDPAEVTRPGTIYTYRGYGWRPRRRVSAEYGSYCSPRAQACAGVGLATRFRADRRGRFTFRLRHGRRLPRSVRRPAGAGGEAATIEFVQWTGRREFRGRRIARDAIPAPPRSTPRQRAEARALGAAFRRAGRALEAFEPAVDRGMQAYDRQLRRCDADLGRFQEGTPQDGVIAALRGLAFEAGYALPIRPRLLALAAEIEALRPADPVLRAGRDAWVAAVRRPRPYPQPDLCTVVERWRAVGFDPAKAPLAAGDDQRWSLPVELGRSRAVREAAARLRALGAGRAAEEAFAGRILELADLIGEF